MSEKKIRIFVKRKPTIKVTEVVNEKKEYLIEITNYGWGDLEL